MKNLRMLLAALELSMGGLGQLPTQTTQWNAGTPPKIYGQYLQRVGKQKWVKSKKKSK